MKRRRRQFTKEPMLPVQGRMREHDRRLLYRSALRLGISQSEALRQAVRAFAIGVLREPESSAATTNGLTPVA